ncbi:hypothetical protein [Kitasatospora aureofaciens]|uniref:hypothetical protein n=1 Tax=Kitasatospora aureofaciens TaxID=1894 RepID=UPI0033D0A0A1
MPEATSRTHRAVLSLIAVALSATAAIITADRAEAATGGEVCLVLAPNNVDLGAGPVGHIGWAFRNGTSSTWTFGATENNDKTGKTNGTFIETSSWNTMLSTFKKRHSGNQQYVKYRCLNTPSSDTAKAQQAARTSATNGYNLLSNNCLTKSVDIFHAYSPWLNDTRHLPDPKLLGVSKFPNHYYNDLLPEAGWGATHNL